MCPRCHGDLVTDYDASEREGGVILRCLKCSHLYVLITFTEPKA